MVKKYGVPGAIVGIMMGFTLLRMVDPKIYQAVVVCIGLTMVFLVALYWIKERKKRTP